jgi:glycosyltransferase involved in cell wall biosynthesis
VSIKRSVPNMQCLILGAKYLRSNRILSRLARGILPIFGYGTVAQRVRKIIRSKNMQGYIHLLPWEKDVAVAIAASDLVVFPSIKPHFARPIIEAGAMAKPVVASRIGGVEELVEDGKTGTLVEPGDSTGLSKAIICILTTPGLKKSMGAQGQARARKLYSNANVKEIEKLYEKLLSKG